MNFLCTSTSEDELLCALALVVVKRGKKESKQNMKRGFKKYIERERAKYGVPNLLAQ